jgi:hypothetical protein
VVFTEDIQSLSRLFADDTSLSYSSSNINEIEQRLNSDIMKIYNWSTKWLVDFNPQKQMCFLIYFECDNVIYNSMKTYHPNVYDLLQIQHPHIRCDSFKDVTLTLNKNN